MQTQPSTSPTRSQLLHAGLRLYPQYGYNGLSVRLLATEAGVSPGMFHHLFTSKDAFVDEILQHKYDEAFTQLLVDIQTDKPIPQRLRQVLLRMGTFIRNNLEWIHRVFADSANGVAVINHFLKNYATRHIALLLDLLAAGEVTGLVVPAAPAQRLTYLVSSVIAPMLMSSRLQSSTLLPPLFAQQLPTDVLSDRAIAQRIDWTLSVLFPHPVPSEATP